MMINAIKSKNTAFPLAAPLGVCVCVCVQLGESTSEELVFRLELKYLTG